MHDTPFAAISLDTLTLLRLSTLKGVGPATLNAVLDRIPHSADPVSWPDLHPSIRKALQADGAQERALESAEHDVVTAARLHARILSPLDPDYPALLALTPDRPVILFVRGNLAPVVQRSVAVIGTREPTDHGKVIADRVVHYFAERGWSIVSGLALGVDGIAHRSALAAGAHTVAVLAHGLDSISPKQHTALAHQILDAGGAWVSEYSFGSPFYAHQFARRDRIQAGLSRGVILVQTAVEGGSLNATRATLRYGRPLAFPVPTPHDIDQKADKIQGILRILESDPIACAEYLHCDPDRLSLLFPLRSRESYPGLEAALLDVSDRPAEAPELDLFS